MTSPADERSESEMDKILEEIGLLEDGMTRHEKRVLIETLEASKISAKTDEDMRLNKDDEVSVLKSSPFLQRQGASATTPGASGMSPVGEPSPLIGGAPMAQRRRPLRAPATLGRRPPSPSTAGSSRQSSQTGDGPQQSSPSADKQRKLSQNEDSQQQSSQTTRRRRQPSQTDGKSRAAQTADSQRMTPQTASQPRSAQSGDRQRRLSQTTVKQQRMVQTADIATDSQDSSASTDIIPQPVQTADGSDGDVVPTSGSRGGSPVTGAAKPARRRRSAVLESDSDDDAVPAGGKRSPKPEASPSPPAAAPEYYVNHEDRRTAVERSARAARLVELILADSTPEENVRRVLEHLEQEHERMLADAEQRPWPSDIGPSRNFQESSLPPPMDPAWLEYRPGPQDERRSPELVEPDASPSPEPAPTPPPTVREPVVPSVPSATAAADNERQHSRANQLLQRAIGTKKPLVSAPKLSLKLSTRPRRDEDVRARTPSAPATEPTARRGSGSDLRSDGASSQIPLLPELPDGDTVPTRTLPTSRRRPASPLAGPSGLSKQPRRNPPSSNEIRPGPLRLPRRPKGDQNGFSKTVMVPLVTRVQTPKRPAPAAPPVNVSSSSDDEDTAAAPAARTATPSRPAPSASVSAASTGRPANGHPVSNSGGGGGGGGDRPAAAPGGSGGAAAASSGQAGDAAAAAVEERVQCPLCLSFFPADKIEAHASRCEGEDVIEIEESHSPPLRRSAVTAATRTRERTPRGWQRCRLCGELMEEGAAYLEHVDECLRRRRQQQQHDGGAGAGGPCENGGRLTADAPSPVTNGADGTTDVHPAAGSSFSPKFQRISAQKNSLIDYHNQFQSGSGGGGSGRKRNARGGRRRGRGRGKSFRGKGKGYRS